MREMTKERCIANLWIRNSKPILGYITGKEAKDERGKANYVFITHETKGTKKCLGEER